MLGYLLCYDIDDDRLRDRLAKRLLRDGQRVQESVFELWLKSPAQFKALQRDLADWLPRDANLRWYRIGEHALADCGAWNGQRPRKPPVAILW